MHGLRTTVRYPDTFPSHVTHLLNATSKDVQSFTACFDLRFIQWLEERGWRAQQVLTYGEIAQLVAGPAGQFAFDVKATGVAGAASPFVDETCVSVQTQALSHPLGSSKSSQS